MRSTIPEKWDREADVVVVGYGSAGVAAAMTAHDIGAKVIVLEKAPQGFEGGNSRVAGQGWANPEPVERTIIYYNALCGPYPVPPQILKAFAIEMGRNNEFIRSLGGRPVIDRKGPERAEYPEMPGSDCVGSYHVDGKLGFQSLWKVLKAGMDQRHIEVLYGTPAEKLIENCVEGEVVGVRASRAGKQLNIKARKAVVLTCGGFENNQDMVRNYLPNLPCCYPMGTPYNTGDGIRMAMEVGADLWHMNNMAGPWFGLKVPEYDFILEITALHHSREFPGGMIVVGPDGRRFGNEKARHTHGKMKMAGQWVQAPTPHPMHMVFDQVLFNLCPLHDDNIYHGWNPQFKIYRWSPDNKAELARGWIKTASTLAELAGMIAVEPAVLEATVAKWNGYCAGGSDPGFGRTKMLLPVEAPPFYAIELSPAFVNTQGGPKRNENARIVRPDGTPIKRLYSAGEMGSIHSYLYEGAGNIGEALAFGRIAGRNAAAEKAWG